MLRKPRIATLPRAACSSRRSVLPAHLVNALGLHARFEQELADVLGDEQKKSCSKGDAASSAARAGAADERARREAVDSTLAAELMMAC